MPIAEIYVPWAVGFARDPKVRALVVRHGIDGMLAAHLYLLMTLYCRENLTDGIVQPEEIGALVYPLPPDHGERLVKLLAEQVLIKVVSNELSNSQANAYLVCAYVKRNGTREDVMNRAAVRAAAGRLGGSRPRSAGEPKQLAKQDVEHLLSQSESESETDPPRAPARAHARGWTPSAVLDQPPTARRGGPRTTHSTVADVVTDAHRPGGPAADVASRAADVRAAMAARPLVDRSGQPPPDEPTSTAGLHGEALAVAQLAETRAARAAELAIGAAAAAPDEPAELAELDADQPPPPDEPSGDDEYPF